jgi:hypothetical protein
MNTANTKLNMWRFIKKWRILCLLEDLAKSYEEQAGPNSYTDEEGHQSIKKEYFIHKCASAFSTFLIWIPTPFRKFFWQDQFLLTPKRIEQKGFIVKKLLEEIENETPKLVEHTWSSPDFYIRTTSYCDSHFTPIMDFVQAFFSRYSFVMGLIFGVIVKQIIEYILH